MPGQILDESYALSTTGEIIRASDRACIPFDPDNADYVAYEAWRTTTGRIASSALVTPFDSEAVARECQRRIYAMASQNCQMNMTAWVASGQASEADKAAFNEALRWVQEMRAAHASLVAAQDANFAGDFHWPACPTDAQALAARF
ncbi:MAG: hypothetical protein KDJ16_07915 [Hyphomicrobiales bacterium]|nr:hypothetical protein [Rhodoblastus sp.]MCC2111944.1 hypothetical protein [Hyphomicrobiales bacterium]